MTTDVIVVGGGAAGCMAALAAAERGASVLLLERNQKIGRKLYITGKGRCNITNDCTPQRVLEQTPHNGRFLTGAVTRFPPEETMAFFAALGVPLKTERGGRVFPQSDRSADVIDALLMALRRAKVAIVQDRAVSLRVENGRMTGVVGEHGVYGGRAVILAAGGASYPRTGSTGDGYAMAQALGHTILPLRPSLVPLVARQDFCAKLQGLSLRNVSIRLKNQKNRVLYTEQGELLFTHFGLSGPLILTASAHMREAGDAYHILIDLKPALEEQALDARLLRELGEQPNRNFGHILERLAPRALIPVLAAQSEIPLDTKANMVTKQGRRRLLETLKGLRVDIVAPRPLEEAVVTSGGVKVTEVNPATMESKLVPGLYLCGEVLDVDAYTGGYNLQIAWSTGRMAGLSAGSAVNQT